MSLGSIVLCPPCLSLSLLFCLDLCFIQGRRWSSHSPPLAVASGRWVHLSGETSPGGRGASSIYSSEVLQQGLCCGTGAQPRGGSRFPNSFARRPPGLRRDHRGPVRGRQLPAPKPADSHGGARRTWSSARTILSQ